MCQAQDKVSRTQEKARGKVSAFRVLGVQRMGASVQTELWEFEQMNTAGRKAGSGSRWAEKTELERSVYRAPASEASRCLHPSPWSRLHHLSPGPSQ